jgi:uncharacterized protein
MRSRRPLAVDWALIVGGTVVGGWLTDRAGLPASYLFVAMIIGLAYALAAPGRVTLPPVTFRVAQAATGVALGTFVQSSILTGLGWSWIPVILVSAATLALTIAAGIMLARIAEVDRPTASLGMVAGGAAGIVAMAGDLGADDRLVAFMQYLRVLVITLLTPLLVPIAFGVHSHVSIDEGPLLGDATGWALVVAAGFAGVLLGSRLQLPAPALLGPLILTAVLTVSGLTGDTQVPALARETAFALIGLWIGLSFDRDALSRIAGLALPVTASIVVLLLACFALGWVLDLTAGVSLLDGYLATTPGGLFAVLPIAYGSGANSTFVLAVQGLRLIAMILAAPLVVRWLVRSQEPDDYAASSSRRNEDAGSTPAPSARTWSAR